MLPYVVGIVLSIAVVQIAALVSTPLTGEAGAVHRRILDEARAGLGAVLIGEAVRRVASAKYIERYEATLAATSKKPAAKAAKMPSRTFCP